MKLKCHLCNNINQFLVLCLSTDINQWIRNNEVGTETDKVIRSRLEGNYETNLTLRLNIVEDNSLRGSYVAFKPFKLDLARTWAHFVHN